MRESWIASKAIKLKSFFDFLLMITCVCPKRYLFNGYKSLSPFPPPSLCGVKFYYFLIKFSIQSLFTYPKKCILCTESPIDGFCSLQFFIFGCWMLGTNRKERVCFTLFSFMCCVSLMWTSHRLRLSPSGGKKKKRLSPSELKCEATAE